MKDYIELTKPRITWLILLSTGIGYYFGLRGGLSLSGLLHTILGTGLIASGTAALNQWYEHDEDGRMKRTRARPIPSGRISPRGALVFGAALAAAGFAELALLVNPLSGFLGLGTLLAYLFLYTPMKRRSWLSTTIGAFPGAMPPLIGYAAAHGSLTADAWVLYAILFLWQFPHFYAIAWMYRDDYARAGIRMLPVVEPDGASTARQIILFLLLLLPVSLLPGYLHMTGPIYLAGASVLGLIFLWSGLRAARLRTCHYRSKSSVGFSSLFAGHLFAAGGRQQGVAAVGTYRIVIVLAENVTHFYGERKALDAVGFEVEPGEDFRLPGAQRQRESPRCSRFSPP